MALVITLELLVLRCELVSALALVVVTVVAPLALDLVRAGRRLVAVVAVVVVPVCSTPAVGHRFGVEEFSTADDGSWDCTCAEDAMES